MEPFNIKIGYGEKEVTLTILPIEAGYYKVIYFGGILGAVYYDEQSDCWQPVPPDDIEAGDLPLYQHDLKADRLEIVLNDGCIQEIGSEIETRIL